MSEWGPWGRKVWPGVESPSTPEPGRGAAAMLSPRPLAAQEEDPRACLDRPRWHQQLTPTPLPGPPRSSEGHQHSNIHLCARVFCDMTAAIPDRASAPGQTHAFPRAAPHLRALRHATLRTDTEEVFSLTRCTDTSTGRRQHPKVCCHFSTHERPCS